MNPRPPSRLRNALIGGVLLALLAPSIAYGSDMTGALPYFFGLVAASLFILGFALMAILHFVFKRDDQVLLVPFLPALLVGSLFLFMILSHVVETRRH